jgi:hypothetical protein
MARDTVQADSVARLRRQLARLTDSSAVLSVRLTTLLASLPDSTRAAVETTVRVLATRAEICETALRVQTDRVTDCQATAVTADSLTREVVPQLHAAVDSALMLAQRWQRRAERTAKPWALTVGVGPGLFWVPGDALVRAGIGATLQVSYRLVALPPW